MLRTCTARASKRPIFWRTFTSSTPCKDSSDLPRNDLPPTTMPRERLRALVSLYHESLYFITPETLDAHIDRVFIKPDETAYDANKALYTNPSAPIASTKAELTRRMERRRRAARRGSLLEKQPQFAMDPDVNPREKASMSQAEVALNNALWGADMGSWQKPGLEMAEEAEDLEDISRFLEPFESLPKA
ncbi:hypothetical protein SISSUDRAFT_1042936 [Sistotremastrum suecicum HHB10207 ss-3]|uniref:Uncharacterized protein n=1 Tax=Sistotremastrum suecicum HHB10207 ss-3 TaxID=1314776 RepID=A0A166G6H2_9AGAM|nr:hypothetical protein SISSUDRAFT_1042936 [Sistotremastrum suecicum HHB10207 ss-3]